MLEVFHEIQQCADHEAIRKTLGRFFGAHGFGASAYAFASHSSAIGHDWIADGFPVRAVATYRRERMDLIDPIPHLVVEQGEPAIWSDVYNEVSLSRQQSRMMRRLNKSGVTDGITFPTYGRQTAVALVSAAQPIDETVIGRCDLPFLQAVVQHAHLRFDQINMRNAERATLSPREREVLFWIAHNKSNNDIATILEISPATVATHVKRIFIKLRASSRIEALLQGIESGVVWF